MIVPCGTTECRCSALPDALLCGQGHDVASFPRIPRSRMIKVDNQYDIHVYAPRVARFGVFARRESRAFAALKVPSVNYDNFDDTGLRVELLARLHGGTEERPCRWKDCEYPVLKDHEICAWHAYAMGDRPERHTLECVPEKQPEDA